MISYAETMSNIISGLDKYDRIHISRLLDIIEHKVGDKTPVIFISNPHVHVMARLSLMLSGKIFYVIPTTMTNNEIISFLTEIPQPFVITDNKDNIKSNSNFAKIYELETYPIDINNSPDTIITIEESFTMFLYDTSGKIVHINEDIFAVLYENAYELLSNNKLLNKPFLCAEVNDFFLQYLIIYISRIKTTSSSFILNEESLFLNKSNTKSNNTLYISYQSYRNIWKEVLSLTLQNKLFFKWFFNKWLGRIIIYIIIRKFEKYFKLFNKIVVLGLITDPILAEISEKLRHSKVYNTYGETSSLMLFGISNKPGQIELRPGLQTISVSLKDNRKAYSIISEKYIESSSTKISQLVMTIRGERFLKSITTNSLFVVKDGYAKFLGYAFNNGVCPAYIESIFNSFPFIKDSAVVWWRNNYILLLDVDEPILDANRINYLFFTKIMKGQVTKVNQNLLPEEIQIKSFGQIPSTIVRYNRLGQLDKEFLYKVEYF